MAISSAPVQTKVGAASGVTSINVTIAAAAAGNTLVVIVGGNQTGNVSAVSCTNVVFAKAKGQTGYPYCEIWYGYVSATSGTTVSILGAPSGAVGAVVTEWQGILYPSPLDAAGTSSQGLGSSASTGSFNTFAGNDLLVGGASCYQSQTVTGEPSGFSAMALQAQVAGSVTVHGSYKVPVAAASQSASWTLSASNYWSCVLVAFKAGIGHYAQTFSETVLMSDGVAKGEAKLFTETATINDSILKATSRALSEAAGFFDWKATQAVKVLEDGFSLIDLASWIRVQMITLFESFSLTDTIASLVKSPVRIVLSEVLGLTDSIWASKPKVLTLRETISLTDTVRRARGRWLRFRWHRRAGMY